MHRKLEVVNYHSRTTTNGNDYLVLNGQKLINFSSNDYLGLSKHKKLIDLSKKWTETYGTSLSSSRFISGNFEKINLIEKLISKYAAAEKSLIFGGGFLMNSTLIPTLTNNNLGQTSKFSIFSDKLNHASINYGCFLTRQKTFRYNHLDLNHLEVLLKKSNKDTPRIIISEILFSMDGDIVDLSGLRYLAKKFNALLYLDEAHSVGVFGKKGFGLASSMKYEKEIVVGTFGKSFGSFGGFVSSTSKIIEKITHSCSGLIYSTALPPGIYASINQAVKLMPSLEKLRTKLKNNSKFLCSELSKINFPIGNSQSQIIPIILGNENKCKKLQKFLRERGFFVKLIKSPTVPIGGERLRISLTATMTKKMLKFFISEIKSFKI